MLLPAAASAAPGSQRGAQLVAATELQPKNVNCCTRPFPHHVLARNATAGSHPLAALAMIARARAPRCHRRRAVVHTVCACCTGPVHAWGWGIRGLSSTAAAVPVGVCLVIQHGNKLEGRRCPRCQVRCRCRSRLHAHAACVPCVGSRMRHSCTCTGMYITKSMLT